MSSGQDFRIDLDEWQEWLESWHNNNFGDVPIGIRATKVMEEAGELGHAVVRLYHCEVNQCGEAEVQYHQADLRDAIGDVVVTVTAIANLQGWNLGDILRETRDILQQRRYNQTQTDFEREEGEQS